MRILTVSESLALKNHVANLLLDDRDVDVAWEGSFDRVLDRFENETFEILLVASQVFRESQEGIEILEVLADQCPVTQVLFLLEPSHVGMVRSVLRAGTYQYARMPVADEELRVLIESAWEQRPQVGTNRLLKSDDGLDDLVGNSVPMQEVYRSIRQAATTDIPVLIQGETGTGKDLAARAIHRQSARSDGPYMTINVGAIPQEMVASELFGHEQGAFPGADRVHAGRFEQAAGGTVFLDEIAAVAEREQISLLRFLEERHFHRLGGTDLVHADVRLLAATNADLATLVREGDLRDDLFYRLDVFRLNLPRLSDRHGDVPLLAGHFIQRYNLAYQKSVLGLTPECSGMLESHPWPGNVRELRNVIQRAVMMCAGEIITPEHLPPRLREPARPQRSDAVTFRVGTTLQAVEREMIVRTLRSTGNNRQQTAQILGISRRALYNKLSRFGIE
jgi:DNA-binding NtrC family response regulator